MASYRQAGPLCSLAEGGSLLDDTLALVFAPPPGPICSLQDFYQERVLVPPPPTAATVAFLFRRCLNLETGLT